MKHIAYLLFAFTLFTACQADKDDELPLSLSKTSCKLTNADNYVIIDITKGAGGYSVSSSNADVAKALVDDSSQPAKLYVFGYNIGEAVITITDKNKDVARVNVSINETILMAIPIHTLVYLKTGDTKELNPQLQNDLEYGLFSANNDIVKVAVHTDSTLLVTGMSAGKCEVIITKDIVRPVLIYVVEVFDILPLMVDRNDIQMRQGDERVLNVFCGNGAYVITQNVSPSIAEIEIVPSYLASSTITNNAKTIKVKALSAGTTTLTITDAQNKTVNVNLVIYEQ